jgi:hypothetical protein
MLFERFVLSPGAGLRTNGDKLPMSIRTRSC